MFFVTEEDGDVPQEYLIPKYELADLCSEAAKLKSLGAMAIVPPERLVRLLNILEKNIRDGAKVTPIVDEVSNCLYYLNRKFLQLATSPLCSSMITHCIQKYLFHASFLFTCNILPFLVCCALSFFVFSVSFLWLTGWWWWWQTLGGAGDGAHSSGDGCLPHCHVHHDSQ